MEEIAHSRNNLKMCPSGRNEGPMVVVVDESFKSLLFNGGAQLP